jgi:tRNA(fMet)-specific endonuclease VapC
MHFGFGIFVTKEHKMKTTGAKINLVDSYFAFLKIAELKYGIAKSTKRENNRLALETFLSKIDILPNFPSLDVYANEKARLKTKGKIIDEFDLLIGATAIQSNLILVTKNVGDFERLDGIVIEDWTTT